VAAFLPNLQKLDSLPLRKPQREEQGSAKSREINSTTFTGSFAPYAQAISFKESSSQAARHRVGTGPPEESMREDKSGTSAEGSAPKHCNVPCEDGNRNAEMVATSSATGRRLDTSQNLNLIQAITALLSELEARGDHNAIANIHETCAYIMNRMHV
jgi:hypothetical protein